MNFKQQVERDVERTFSNLDEFADMTVFHYNKKRFKCPVVLDRDVMQDRDIDRRRSDNAQGIFVCDLRMFVALKHIKTVPRKNMVIEFENGESYRVMTSDNQMGQVVIDLEAYDE